MASNTEFLHEEVYPNLNAADAGLLDNFNPMIGRASKAYSLTCPLCNKDKEAFYYPGSSRIMCHRKKKCGKSISIWDAYELSHKSTNQETFLALCNAANVPPPNSKLSDEQRSTFNLKKGFIKICKDALLKNKEAMTYLAIERNISKDDLTNLEWGFYPSIEYIEKALQENKANMATALKWGLIPDHEGRKYWKFNGRIVGFWTQEDGSIRLWGRLISEPNNNEKKYHFAPGLSKTRPYNWFGPTRFRPIMVEGTIDSDSLQLLGIPGQAIGQAQINQAQARFLAQHGIKEVTHLTDGDKAGQQGAVDSTRNCEPLGITTYIAMIPEGMDDPDTLRKKGQHTKLQKLIDTPMLGGEYVARMIITSLHKYLHKPNAENAVGRIFREGMKIRSKLTPVSAAAFDMTLKNYGVNLDKPEVRAARLYTTLKEHLIDEKVIQQIIRNQCGLTLDINLVEN